MASQCSELFLCYNKGCGNKYDPKENKKDSCCFHPGNPVFHDAYKGWSCCNKKSIDFTEFLNLKGCTISYHSNVKPPQPQKPAATEKAKCDEVYEYRAPTPKVSSLKRPSFGSSLTRMKPEVSNLLRAQVQSLVGQQAKSKSTGEIQVGTNCKNSGCKAVYEGPSSGNSQCLYHSGSPIFHEGLKYWSCCMKKTTDFSAFLEQVGCTAGEHVWIKEKSGNTESNCRYDWHQTPSYVVLSIYAKKYDPDNSFVELNPVRAKIHIQYPFDNSHFDRDLELYGIIDVSRSEVSMLQTKIEIKLKKAESGSWLKLDVPVAAEGDDKRGAKGDAERSPAAVDVDDAVDLEDIN